MNSVVRVRVLKISVDGSAKELFRQSVEVDSSVMFSFSEVQRVLKVLFPRSSCVEFSVMY